MAASEDPSIKIISDISTLKSFLDSIDSTRNNQPCALFVDLEGIKLSRHGSISILSIYVHEHQKAYLIDVHQLGTSAFTTCNDTDMSLKGVLEDVRQAKVIFDVRNDSDALFAHYQVSLAGVQDLQLMELACRSGSKAFVSGQAKCVEIDSGLDYLKIVHWRQRKERGMRLFAPERGGCYEIFNERPLRPEIAVYCAQDVMIMMFLYKTYNAKLDSFWEDEVEKATYARIQESQSPSYDPQSREKARGPWSNSYIAEARKQWEWELEEMNYRETVQDCDWYWEEDKIARGAPF